MDESIRRRVNIDSDSEPTYHHKYNLAFSLPYIRNKRVLDIGCWTGQFEKIAIQKVKTITGIDPGIEAIRIAKRMVPKANFVVANALKIPFSKKKFDTVTLLDVIEHIPLNTEEDCLREIKRVLKPNGYLILSTPSSHPLSIILDPAYFIIGHRHYSKKRLMGLLKKTGFELVNTKYTGGFFTMFSGIVGTFYKHLLKKKFIIPGWWNEKINYEYKNKGFTEVHIVAKVSNN